METAFVFLSLRLMAALARRLGLRQDCLRSWPTWRCWAR